MVTPEAEGVDTSDSTNQTGMGSTWRSGHRLGCHRRDEQHAGLGSPSGITSLASGSMPSKRVLPPSENTMKMSVEKETLDRVSQIQAQIAILQRELDFLMPAEDA